MKGVASSRYPKHQSMRSQASGKYVGIWEEFCFLQKSVGFRVVLSIISTSYYAYVSSLVLLAREDI